MSENDSPLILKKNDPQRLESVFDVLSRIQILAEGEKRGGVGFGGMFTIKDQWDLFTIGFLKTFKSGLMTALFTPFFMGVVEKLIPVFGGPPTAFDEFLGLMLTVGFPLIYASIVYNLGQYYVGDYTKKMIRNFLSGVMWGAFCKLLLVFIAFHWIALVLLTEKRVAKFLLLFAKYANADKLERIYIWLMNFKHVFIASAYFVAATTLVIQIGIPIFSIMYKKYRNRQYVMEDDF